MRKNNGFTLIEVMVAVAIFAIVATTLLKSSTRSVSQSRHIQDRTLALWIAEDTLQQVRMRERDDEHFPSTGTDRSSVTMANREWQVELIVSSTENELVRRVEVQVFDEQDLDSPLSNLTGFVGRH
jgi:general secretion pathway protein I